MPDYFRSNTNRAADIKASQVLTQNIHKEISNVFSGIGSFEGTFRLQVKEVSWPYQKPQKGTLHTSTTPWGEDGQST